jgi:hypothetical protein
MKSIISIFLFVFAMASCQPKCDCERCAEECQIEATTVDSTEVNTTVTPTDVESK